MSDDFDVSRLTERQQVAFLSSQTGENPLKASPFRMDRILAESGDLVFPRVGMEAKPYHVAARENIVPMSVVDSEIDLNDHDSAPSTELVQSTKFHLIGITDPKLLKYLEVADEIHLMKKKIACFDVKIELGGSSELP